MVEAKSFVDFLTIPPFLASMYLNRTWIGKNAIDCWNKQQFNFNCFRFAMFSSATSFIDSDCFKEFKFTENPTLNTAGRGGFYFCNHCVDSWWYNSFGEYWKKMSLLLVAVVKKVKIKNIRHSSGEAPTFSIIFFYWYFLLMFFSNNQPLFMKKDYNFLFLV